VCDSIEEGQWVAQEKIKLLEMWAKENYVGPENKSNDNYAQKKVLC